MVRFSYLCKKKMTTEETKKYLLDRCVKKDNGCWEWTMSTCRGYGNFRRGGMLKLSHRESYRVFIGDIPVGLYVCHHCDNRLCINPEHLFIGTHQDNMDDMMQKGRHRSIPQYGNNYSSKKVMAGGQEFASYSAAGRALGISDVGVRRRISLGWEGYKRL